MPTISQFYGILIRIFYNDHAPPHFHAVYGEHELVVGISPVSILDGAAPPRVRSMVLEWTALMPGGPGSVPDRSAGLNTGDRECSQSSPASCPRRPRRWTWLLPTVPPPESISDPRSRWGACSQR
ncbi:MAG: DUF4160 domain-containing protein [Gemmatimonadetes bacterium]|nr:DUF4160 domain-containing protein [Gemmatimonadota bacterium]